MKETVHKESESRFLRFKKILLLVFLIFGAGILSISCSRTKNSIRETDEDLSKATEDVFESESEFETEAEILNSEEIEEFIEPSENTLLNEQAETLISKMSLEEKVAQLFMVTPEALTGVSNVITAGETTKNSLAEYPVGGLIYFAGNIQSENQLEEMIENQQAYAQNISGIPLFIATDEEGGDVTRIASSGILDVPLFESISEIGKTEDTNLAYELGNEIGTYMYQLGFNLDFAPVADVLTNPDNTVVKNRSFGSDAVVVSEMVLSETRGLQDAGVYATLKHFPGHGATSADTHEGYAYTDKTLDQLMEEELIPFQDGIDAGVSFIMASHIAVPNVTGDDIPASLSEQMLTGVLRTQMGYDGIIVTDALNMGAVTKQYTSAEAAVMAIHAGADILLMPADFRAAYQGVIEAVKDGRISEQRIEESLYRIVTVKLNLAET